MKKLIAMLLAVTMLAALLAGCGNTTAPDTTDAPAGTVAGPEATDAPVDTTEAPEQTESVDPTDGAQVEASELQAMLMKLNDTLAVEFMPMIEALDLTDTSEDGLWRLKGMTGMENADLISEAAFYEPMMGSIAFSVVAVRAADAANAKTVAETMKANIDPAKWICVAADDVMAAGFGDIVLFVMVNSELNLPAQDIVNTFAEICGSEADFTV